ncbi:hypothetical protein N8612_04700 [Verrucomicrobia bacterium]|nr:hypothetical protein [Verrucomicrobiota bacterium]
MVQEDLAEFLGLDVVVGWESGGSVSLLSRTPKVDAFPAMDRISTVSLSESDAIISERSVFMHSPGHSSILKKQ